MRDDQLPIDLPCKQCVDMTVASGFIRSAEGDIIPVAHARHQHDAKQSAKSEDWLALALGIGMQCIGLQKAIKNVNRFPDTARNEAGKQGNIAVSDMMVGNATISAVSNVGGTQEIVLAQRYVRAVGNGRISGTPHFGQRKSRIFTDDITHRRFELVGVDVLGIYPPQHLRGGNIGGVPCRLTWPEIAAITEDCEQVTPDSLGQFWIRTGWRSKMACVSVPRI